MSFFFSWFLGNESQCGTNKSRELRSFFLCSWEMNCSAEQINRTRTASRFTRFVCSALRFISHEPRKKRHSVLKKITFSIYACIYISFTCCWVRLNLITSKTKKEGGTRGFVPLLLDRTSARISLIFDHIL